MQFATLLGKALKDDEVIEILEHFDMPVIYDFDRSHENMDDFYWASSEDVGLQMRFNKDQILDVIFFYLVERHGFQAVDRSLLDTHVYETFEDAERACIEGKIPYKISTDVPGSNGKKWWIKLDHGRYTAHYQFKDERVIMMSLSAKMDEW